MRCHRQVQAPCCQDNLFLFDNEDDEDDQGSSRCSEENVSEVAQVTRSTLKLMTDDDDDNDDNDHHDTHHEVRSEVGHAWSRPLLLLYHSLLHLRELFPGEVFVSSNLFSDTLVCQFLCDSMYIISQMEKKKTKAVAAILKAWDISIQHPVH